MTLPPTLFPTYSVRPTLRPTSSPSISPLSLWKGYFSDYLLTLPPLLVTRGIFSHLSLHGAAETGGCLEWNSFLRDEVETFLITLSPMQLTISVLTSHLGVVMTNTTQCNSASSNLQLLQFLIGSTTSSFFSQSLVCNGNRYFVWKCGIDDSPVICSNCEDFCTSPPPPTLPLVTCNGGTSPEILRVFSLEFGYKWAAPKILSMGSHSVTNTSFIVSVQLESQNSTGSVFCDAFPSRLAYSLSDVAQLRHKGRGLEVHGSLVDILMDGLIPSTSYDIFCVSYSSDNVPLSLELVRALSYQTTTLCCRQMTVSLTSSYFSESQTLVSVLTISLKEKPPGSLVVSFRTVNQNISGAPVVFSPSAVSFSSESILGSVTIGSILSSPGRYEIVADVHGSSESLYQIVYSNGNTFGVLGVFSQPPPPRCASAMFSDTGNFVNVNFDSPTNMGQTSTVFKCSKLLNFRGITPETRCVWSSSRVLEVYSSGDSGLQIGDSVTLLPSSLQARCLSTNCSNWSFSPSHSILISGPSLPAKPQIQISAPTLIGSCASFRVDLSKSSGGGGRSWKQLSVTTLDRNASMLQSFLSRVDVRNMSSPITIPPQYLTPGTAYTLMVKLCNFLLGCSQQVHQFVVSSSQSIPIISINTQPYRTMNTRMPLTIPASAYTMECGSSSVPATSSLEFSWKILQDGIVLPELQSVSLNSREFYLKPYSLSVGLLYTVVVTVKSLQSQKSSSSSVMVFTQAGEIHAVMKGGNDLGLPVDGMVEVDGSLSFDEDLPNVFGVEAGLSFAYQCIQVEPLYRDFCELDNHSASESLLQFSVGEISDPSLLRGAIFEVTMIVTSGDRTATSITKITVLDALAPSITLTSSNGNRINPSEKLKLYASIGVRKSSGSAIWSVDDPRLVLSTLSLAPLQKSISYPSSSVDSDEVIYFTHVLVFPPSSLNEDSSYTFTLTCSLESGFVSTSSIVITTNSPPLPGSFSIDPPDGTMFSTKFTFSALNWEDVDLPLTFEFAKEAPGNVFLVFRTRLEQSYTVSQLSSGNPVNDYGVKSRLQVFDTFDAVTTMFGSVVVSPVSYTAEQLQLFLTTAVGSAHGDTDHIRSAMTSVSLGVNPVDCSGMSYCQTINRYDCSDESFSCGSCLPGFFGEFGNGITPCLSDSHRHLMTRGGLRLETEVDCVHNSDCQEELLEYCHESRCKAAEKTCLMGCSSRGECVPVSIYNSSQRLESCSIFDSECVMICDCSSGYLGRACEKDASEYEIDLETRYLLVVTLSELIRQENPSKEAVIGWINTLTSLCGTLEDLRLDARLLLLEIAIDILGIIRDLSIPLVSEDVSEFSRVFDVAASIGSIDSSLADQFITEYTSFVLSDMELGQYALNVRTRRAQMSAYAFDEGSSTHPEMTLWKSKFDELSDKAVPFMHFGDVNYSPFKAILTQTSSSPHFPNSTSPISSPLNIQFISNPCGSGQCNVTIVVPRRKVFSPSGGGSWPSNSSDVVRFECQNDQLETLSQTCPSLGREVTFDCNGTAGIYVQPCPVLEDEILCFSANPLSTSTLPICTLLSFTELDVTCSCSLTFENRRLQDSPSDSSFALSFTTVSQSVLRDFVGTWSGVDDLTASSISQSWEVLVTVMTLGVLFFLALLFGYRQDQLDLQLKDAKPNENKMRTRHRGSKRRQSATSGVKAVIQKEYRLLEEALPHALQSEPMWNKVIDEVKTYHRWLGIIFYHSPQFSRVLRIASVGSNVVIVLFVQALTYNITNPDDGSCEQLSDPEDCTKRNSPIDPSQSLCSWDDARQHCSYNDIKRTVTQVASIAILCSLLSAPLALCVQLVLSNILSAPADNDKPTVATQVVKLKREMSAILNLRSGTIVSDPQEVLRIQGQLLAKLRRYRSSLPSQDQKELDGKTPLALLHFH